MLGILAATQGRGLHDRAVAVTVGVEFGASAGAKSAAWPQIDAPLTAN
jgi:hypothetical protein